MQDCIFGSRFDGDGAPGTANTRQSYAVSLAHPACSLFQTKKRSSTPKTTMSPYFDAIRSSSRRKCSCGLAEQRAAFLASVTDENAHTQHLSFPRPAPSVRHLPTPPSRARRLKKTKRHISAPFYHPLAAAARFQRLALRTTMSPYFDAIRSPSRPRTFLRSLGAAPCFLRRRNRRKYSDSIFELPAKWVF